MPSQPINNRHIIDDALNVLATALSPFVASKTDVVAQADVSALLGNMLGQWDGAFHADLGYRGKNLVYEIRDIRNDWAPYTKSFDDDDTDRALDSIGRLLVAIGAASEAATVNRTKEECRLARYRRTVPNTPAARSESISASHPQQQMDKWEGFARYLRDGRRMKESTISSRIANCKRAERYEGNLDEHFDNDQCHALLRRLTYSADDLDRKWQPQHNIPINGHLRTGSASLKCAVGLYAEFRKNRG